MPKSGDRQRRSRRGYRSPLISSPESGDRRKTVKKSVKSDKKRRRSPSRSRASSPDSESSCSTCRARSRSRSPPRKSRKIRKPDKERRGREREKLKSRKKPKARRRRSPSLCSTCSGSISSGSNYSSEYSDDRVQDKRVVRKSTKNALDDVDAVGRDKIIQAYDDCPPLTDRKGKGCAVDSRIRDSGEEQLAIKNENTAVKSNSTSLLVNTDVKDVGTVRRNGDASALLNSAAVKDQKVSSVHSDDALLSKGKGLIEEDNPPEKESYLEMVLRQKALENFIKFRSSASVGTNKSSNLNNQSDAQAMQSQNPVSQSQGQVVNSTSSHTNSQPKIRSVVTIPSKDNLESGIIESPLSASTHSRDSDTKFASEHARDTGISNTPPVINISAKSDKSRDPEIEKSSMSKVNVARNEPRIVQLTSSRVLQRELSLLKNGIDRDIAVEDSRKNVAENNGGHKDAVFKVKDTIEKTHVVESENSNTPTVKPESGIFLSKNIEATEGNAGCSNSVVASEKNEPVADGGSQFEQKSFSRMHDGEVVQVSYKVYIPKKSPALARKRLQR